MHILKLLKTSLRSIVFFIFFSTGLLQPAFAQDASSAKNKSPFPVKYRSLTDERMLLRTLTLAPVYDNMNGIYSQPIQKLLVDLLQSDKAWGYAEIQGHNNRFVESYDLNPNDVLEVLTKTKAQGLLTAYVTKGPRGLNAKLKLFTHDEGLLLLEESSENADVFEISKLRDQFTLMYQNLKNKLPYRGYVLSRRGQEVTVSVGSINGVRVGQELSIAQIIKLNRHPKLKLLVGVEKEIIAKVQVTKADPYLSFAQIIFEKETGVVDIGAKVLPHENVNYPRPELSKDGAVIGDISETYGKMSARTGQNNREPQPDDLLVQKQREELFDRENSDGSIFAQGLIAQYSDKQNLQSGASYSGSQSFAPGILVGGKYNFYKNFQVQLSHMLTKFSINNDLSGSSPFTLGVNLTKTSGLVSYTYNFDETYDEDDGTPVEEISDNYGIVFTGGLGFANYKTDVDTTSPTAYTSTSVNMILVQAKASIPLNTEKPMRVGAQFELAFSPTYGESPVSSGSAATSFTGFGFFGVYELNDKFNLIGDLTLTSINTTFTGSATRANPAASTKMELTTQQFGIEYLF